MNYRQFREDTKKFKRQSEELEKVKYKCKCGHRVVIKDKENKVICSWCNKYVFKTKKDEDLYRIKEKMYERKKGYEY